MNIASKIFNSTIQQRISCIHAKNIVQKTVGINDNRWGELMMEVGEYVVNDIWRNSDAAYRHKILTDDTLGFWITFKYEWMMNDKRLVQSNTKLGDERTYIFYKKQYFTAVSRVREALIYRVEKY